MKTPRVSVAREHTGDTSLDRAQRLAQQVTQTINANPLIPGKLIATDPTITGAVVGTGLVFTAGQTRFIPHGLGRKCVGWFEVYGTDLPSAARVGLFAVAMGTGLSSTTHVALKSTSAGTCQLFVF